VTRAMILAAGLGTRLRPLTEACAKPALPVCGVPVIAYLLDFLKHHGVTEVIINLHYLPETVRAAVANFGPGGIQVSFSEEAEPLGTGGGIRKARAF
jgi:NDP-sugar pyrophosphorylase family protein